MVAPNNRRTIKSAVLLEYDTSSNFRQNRYLVAGAQEILTQNYKHVRIQKLNVITSFPSSEFPYSLVSYNFRGFDSPS